MPVSAPSLAAARRAAVAETLELFLAQGSTASLHMADVLGARASEMTGRARWKGGKAVVEVRFGPILRALDSERLLRPEGFTSKEPRVLLLVSEPQGILDLGVGPAADALRRSLSAQGMSAVDGRDDLNNFLAKGRTPADFAAGAARLGANWMLIAAASASAERDPVSGAWRGRATLIADQYEVRSATPVVQSSCEATTLDVSSMAARGKALEQAGEEMAGKVVAAITRLRGGRAEGAVFVVGGPTFAKMKSLLTAVRSIEGVAGAYLGSWRDEDKSVILRVFMTGLKIDGLAARLLLRDASLTLLSVETESGRLAVEIASEGDE